MRPATVHVVIVAALVSGWGIAPVLAQVPPRAVSTPQTPSGPPTRDPQLSSTDVLLRVDVVISRMQGDKKIGSLPYTLFAALGSNASLRLGQQVPVRQSLDSGITAAVTYQSTGTNIDFTHSTQRADGRYEYLLNLSANYFYATPGAAGAPTSAEPGQPVFGNYTVSNTLMSRDGQPLQFSIATDRVTGETLRAEVTVTAVK